MDIITNSKIIINTIIYIIIYFIINFIINIIIPTSRPHGAVWPTQPDPQDLSKHIQQAWNASVITAAYNILMSTSQSQVDQARLKAVVIPHTGDWLHASLLTIVGLRLSDKAIQVAIG